MYYHGLHEWLKKVDEIGELKILKDAHWDLEIGAAANWLDPSIHPDLQPYPFTQGSRIGIDATKQFKGFDFAPGAGFRPEDLKRMKKRWPDYGI